MRQLILLISIALTTVTAMGQGKPHAKIFSNFHYQLSDDTNPFKAFEVNRSYLGYGYTYNDKFSAKITFDVGNNDGGSSYTAFLKIAQISWNVNQNLNIKFGQIGTKNFKFMEKTWGYRYIYKSLQDQHQWASAADIGVSADYKVHDLISLDLQVINGEGYKQEQDESGLFRGGLGLNFTPSEKLAVRLYRDMSPRKIYTDEYSHQHTTTGAIAYNSDKINMGFEYNIQENSSNITNQIKKGTSVYATYEIVSTFSIFGRYDELTSENDWNLNNDGSLMIAGIEKEMTKGVKIALNYQTWTEATDNTEAENTIYLNLEYTF